MDDEDFIDGTFANSDVFDHPDDSDIILKCGDRQIMAHRVLLRLWSPFFARTFKSQFSVAKGAVFVIDPDDNKDHVPLYAILMHVYGMPFGDHPSNDTLFWNDQTSLLDTYIKVFTLADKYDFPEFRRHVVHMIRDHLKFDQSRKSAYESVREMIPEFPESIANVCGPDAPQLADPAMRDCLFGWLANNFDFVCKDPDFKAKLEDGSLLDTELTTKLLFKLGEQNQDPVEHKGPRPRGS